LRIYFYIQINTAYLSVKNDDGVCEDFVSLRCKVKDENLFEQKKFFLVYKMKTIYEEITSSVRQQIKQFLFFILFDSDKVPFP
jgi:hypothetical protein